jgi:Protein of unknown function (DUF1622)
MPALIGSGGYDHNVRFWRVPRGCPLSRVKPTLLCFWLRKAFELLVGADIIATITAPLTILSVGLLAGIVLIRTFLSFSLETEIEGCWPWQRAAEDAVRGERDQR